MGLKKLSAILKNSSVIDDQAQLKWAANMLGWGKFRKGHYFIDHGFTYDDFLSKLSRGIQDPVSVTIIPGKSMGGIARAVSSKMEFDSLSFQNVLTDSLLLDSLKLTPKQVIGRLYPNTYSFYWTSSPGKVFERILETFDKDVLQKYRAAFNKDKLSVNNIITLASIIEWETTKESEKKTISGLYRNRLSKGMKLQSDPTINFAVGKRRRLLYKDYKVKDPYNTYLHKGLPPGPITNPGLSSIKAALNPGNNNYLYMVANPSGGHSFSETYREHKQKSAKWRKWLQKQYRIKQRREQESKGE